jgi:hypothetical protein
VITSLQAALKRAYMEVTDSQSKELIPFPLDFSATIDGIDGIIFGNVVTTNYLPPVYQSNKVAFTVTKVEHEIQNNDWTTTISTVCREIS